MKKLFTLLIAVSFIFTAHSQSWLSDVGLPPDLSVLENYQCQSKTTHQFVAVETLTFVKGKFVYSYSSTTEYTDQLFGAYPLNMVYDYLYSDGLQYIGNEDGNFHFRKESHYSTVEIGQFAGQTYFHGWTDVIISPTENGYDCTMTFYPFMNTERNGLPAIKPWASIRTKGVNATRPGTNYKPTYSNKTMLADLIKSRYNLDENSLGAINKHVWHFVRVNADAETHVTSIFGKIEKNGNTYINKTLINGKDWHLMQAKGLITSFGKPISSLSFSWVYYNNCEIPVVKPSDANSTGNFGECFRKMYGATDPRCESFVVNNGGSFSENPDGSITSDQNKTSELLQLVVHRNPMPEKNTEQEGYWNVKTGVRAFSLF